MTDEQWLDLIETTAPEELTLAQIDELRQRLSESPMLRAALSTRIEMEQYLAAALGRVNVSIDSILAQAGNAPALTCQSCVAAVGLGPLPAAGGLRGTGFAIGRRGPFGQRCAACSNGSARSFGAPNQPGPQEPQEAEREPVADDAQPDPGVADASAAGRRAPRGTASGRRSRAADRRRQTAGKEKSLGRVGRRRGSSAPQFRGAVRRGRPDDRAAAGRRSEAVVQRSAGSRRTMSRAGITSACNAGCWTASGVCALRSSPKRR